MFNREFERAFNSTNTVASLRQQANCWKQLLLEIYQVDSPTQHLLGAYYANS